MPLLPPHGGTAERLADGWRFRFLGRASEMTAGIDWRAPGHDQLWRMNLHYMSYLEAVTDTDFASLVADWIASNPPYAPGSPSAAWSAYALSLRVVVWMQQLATRSARLDPGLIAKVEASLGAQLFYLEGHLETDVGGNHLIKNLKALLWASRFFTGAAAARWRARGLSLLRRELGRQILADGLHYERSTSYHAQVFADLVEIRHALGADPFEGALDTAVRRMAQPLADLAHPDGTPALFNDSGLTMAPAPRICLAALGGTYAAQNRFAYPESGYFGCRNDAYCLIADFGPVGPDDLPAHAQGDIGSFELSVAGERLIVDPGVFEYLAGQRRSRSRSAAAHNVLWVEGADQAEFFGAFRCARRPVVRATWAPRDEGFILEGWHDGYGARAWRRIDAGAEEISIEDWLEGEEGRPASVSFLLHPGARVERVEGGLRIARGRSVMLLRSEFPLSVEKDVWWPDMGVELATSRIRLLLLGPGHGTHCTFVFPNPKGSH